MRSKTLEKETQSQDVKEIEAGFDVNSKDLPKNYFISPLFLGTFLASGFSMSAVSFPLKFRRGECLLGRAWEGLHLPLLCLV